MAGGRGDSVFFLLYCTVISGRVRLINGLFLFIPTTLALITCLLILFYIASTSNFFLLVHPPQFHIHLKHPFAFRSSPTKPTHFSSFPSSNPQHFAVDVNNSHLGFKGSYVDNYDMSVFHDSDIFINNYNEMNETLKIYIYPHREDDPFAEALLPVDFEPGGNYASESYFKKVLTKSHFITNNPLEAHLFFMPFSIARLRHDPRVGTDGIKDFIKSYVLNITHEYPFWNRTGGADHFYVACHSIGRIAMEKTPEIKLNAIQIVCSSSYYLSAYIPHKDASLPQIWPRQEDPQNLTPYNRTKLVFFAGAINSPVREKLVESWGNDSEIFVNSGHIKTSYTEELLNSKFCLHVKGFEVNTARIGDALYYGCVPVIIANHYDLPFADILNWKRFSVIVATLDIPLLKEILGGISFDEYQILQNNVVMVRKHFQWNLLPVDYDAFYMVMYELWIRRNSLRISL